jgi:protease I
MARVLVLYHSTYGHIEQMAYAVAEGAREVAGVEADVKRVAETVPEEVARQHHFKLDQPAPVAQPQDLAGYDAVIVPSGMVADRLRYAETAGAQAPAVRLLARAFAEPSVLKGIICHGLWLVAPTPELVRGRKLTVHNNLLGDARNMGAEYVDADVVVDGDLVTGRTGQHAHLFARKIIEMLAERRAAAA